MSRVLSIFDTHDLTTLENAQRFAFSRDAKDLNSFVDGIRASMLDEERASVRRPPKIDDANYLPGCSLRGDGGCLHWNCRLPKVRAMARYIALYCDKAIVPIRLTRYSKNDIRDEFLERMRLCGIILGIIELRPLIEAGLVALVPEELHLCKEHWNEAVPEHKKIWSAAKRLAGANSDRFSVTYYPAREPLGSPSLRFKGPEEYLEHGEIRTVLEDVPRWLKSLAAAKPKALTQATVRRHGLVDRFFLPMANDAFLQTYFGTAFNARYVTDSPGEGEFFRLLYGREELARRTATLCAHLSHTVPIMAEVPLGTILKLRKSEPQVFDSYRSTLTEIVKTHAGGKKRVTDADAKAIYLDVLKPKLDGLEAQAVNLRRSQLKKSSLKIAASSLLIGIGLYGGVLPSQLVDLVKAIGGFSVAKDLVETLGSFERNPTEIRNHNLYFLLRLKQEGRGRTKRKTGLHM